MAQPSEQVGPIVHAGVVEQAVIATLQRWLRTYLIETARQSDLPRIAAVKSWAVASDYDRWPEQKLPAVIVSAPGTDENPNVDGSRMYRASYELRVTVEVASANGADARLIGQVYNAAVRVALMQHRSLGGGLRATHWRGESNTTLEIGERRTRFAAQNIFSVAVRDLFTENGALTDPLPDEEQPGDLIEIIDYGIEVVKDGV